MINLHDRPLSIQGLIKASLMAQQIPLNKLFSTIINARYLKKLCARLWIGVGLRPSCMRLDNALRPLDGRQPRCGVRSQFLRLQLIIHCMRPRTRSDKCKPLKRSKEVKQPRIKQTRFFPNSCI